jgi:hypothetical protein
MLRIIIYWKLSFRHYEELQEEIMAIRRRTLPHGWYPDEPETLRALVAFWVPSGVSSNERGSSGVAVAAIAPHAGWIFSGRLAARAAASLAPTNKGMESRRTLVVMGGHLPPGARPLAAQESAFETPVGMLEADSELLAAFEGRLGLGRRLGRDTEPDNTVEVLLPLVAVLFPGIRVLWLRAPNDPSALELGEALSAASLSIGREVVCLGSSDLTHYGPNYNFSPKGRGRAAEDWVRDVNDRRFIEAIMAMNGAEAIRRGESERSACSSGAASAALAFARASGASRAELFEYATSLDVRRDDSFVGYAAIGFYH